jgi:rubrerythrin
MKFSEEALTFLNLGIESEIAAYVFYQHVRKVVADESLRKIVEKLAADEKGHFLILENEYDENVRSECWAPYKDILAQEGLPEIDELVQDTHKELIAKIAKLKDKKGVLEMALSLEKEAFGLFSDASARSKSPDVKKVFDHLAAFEKGHVQTIEKELLAL